MSRYFVGLDFGTHQTKVCIKDTKTNPHSYQFIEFRSIDGVNKLMIPSIVQVNKDGTLSYGFVKEFNCKEDAIIGEFDQKFNLAEPILELPSKPIEIRKENIILASLASLKHALLGKRNATPYQIDLKNWEEKCIEIKRSYNNEVIIWKEKRDCFKDDYEKWKSCNSTSHRMRYFKLASFDLEYDKNYSSNHELTSEKTSILFIAYILFCIQECIGNDFFVQMGIPSGKDRREFERQRTIAERILISANELNKQYQSKQEYLNSNYHDLIQFTPAKNEIDVEHYELGLQAIPEAYAGLSAIVKNGRLSKGGIHLHIDIGGGTTDASIFTLGEKGDDTEIYSIKSFHKGLNFIIENTEIDYYLSNDKKHQIFNDSKGKEKIFQYSIQLYLKELDVHLNKMISELRRSFDKKAVPKSNLYNAIINQPRAYCGGGSLYEILLNSEISYFNDKRRLTKENVAPNAIFKNKIQEIDGVFTLLVVAFGLSEFVIINKNPYPDSPDEIFIGLPSTNEWTENQNNSRPRDIRDFDS